MSVSGADGTVLALDYIRDTRNRDPSQAMEAALYTHADTGVLATEMALERAGITRDAIGMVIAGSSRPGLSSPADACHIAAGLGMEVPALDINSACTSMWVAMYMLSNMRPESLPDYVLVVTPESLTTTVDYNDRAASVLWGDCTAAAIVSTRIPSRIQMLENTVECSPAGYEKVVVPPLRTLRPRGAHRADVRHQEDRAITPEDSEDLSVARTEAELRGASGEPPNAGVRLPTM